MKHCVKKLAASLLALSMTVGMGTAASAATKSSNTYDLYVTDEKVQFLLNGKAAATYDLGGNTIELTTDKDGDFLVCFYDDRSVHKGISLGDQSSLRIRGTVKLLQVRSALDSSIDLHVDSNALVKDLKLFSANDLSIDGRVTNLLVDTSAKVEVSSSATVSNAELLHNKATLYAEKGATVKNVKTVNRLNVKGSVSRLVRIDDDRDVYDDDDDDSDGDKVRVRLEVGTIYGRKGDTLRDLTDDLNNEVYAYVRNRSSDDDDDEDGDPVSGRVRWRGEDTREELESSGRYNFTFTPRNSKYESVRGSIQVIIR